MHVCGSTPKYNIAIIFKSAKYNSHQHFSFYSIYISLMCEIRNMESIIDILTTQIYAFMTKVNTSTNLIEINKKFKISGIYIAIIGLNHGFNT